MAIVLVADFQTYVRDKLGAVDTAILQRSLTAAESAVRAHCHRSFDAVGAASARVFVPESGTVLRVDGFTTITSVSNDGSTVASTSYQLEPLNGRSLSGDVVPYDTIRLTSGAWTLDGDRATVTVTAAWGWVTIPEAVKEAVMVLGKDIADRREMRGNVAGFGDMGAVRVGMSTDALGLLRPFVRWDRAGIA